MGEPQHSEKSWWSDQGTQQAGTGHSCLRPPAGGSLSIGTPATRRSMTSDRLLLLGPWMRFVIDVEYVLHCELRVALGGGESLMP